MEDKLDDLPEWVKFVNKYANENKGRSKGKKKLTLEDLVFQRLQELQCINLPNRIIRFPTVFSKICSIYCLTKDQVWQILGELEKSGRIEIVPYQGIIIKTKSHE
jgi:hypothetical protein